MHVPVTELRSPVARAVLPVLGGAAVLALIAPYQVLWLPLLAVYRSLNLANAAAVAVYVAWRQTGSPGAG